MKEGSAKDHVDVEKPARKTQKPTARYIWIYSTYILVLQRSTKRQSPQIDLQTAWFAILRPQTRCTRSRQIR
jgi:hypothetical protein